ncbi:MAG: threonylcarbamoyl-AMP synthase [Marinilabiliales bacterium]|nr:MAG: threonylcarbamoyl-AMP synthase [Marinilabiliales bacterium]
MTLLDYKKDIDACLKVLRNEGAILYPTDTIWGLGCDATSEKAVNKIYDIKQRCESKAFIILLSDVSQLETYVEKVPPIALDLIEKVHTPLTIIYENVINLPGNLIPEDNTIAIRIVKNEFVKDLICAFGRPIVSTSANISGEANPLMYAEIDSQIINSVDYVVEYMRHSIQQVQPSTIIKVEDEWNYEVIRS